VNKYEMFVAAYKSKLVYNRTWLLRAFTVPHPTDNEDLKDFLSLSIEDRVKASTGSHGSDDAFYFSDIYLRARYDEFKPGYMYTDQSGTVMSLTPSMEFTAVTGLTANEPVYTVTEPVNVKADDILMVKEDTKSYYSTLVTNLLLFEFAFGDKFPYWNKAFDSRSLDSAIAAALKDGTIDVPERLKHSVGVGMLYIFTVVAVPSASPKSATSNPESRVLRAKLLEKYKDELDNPVIQSKIEAELIKLDREWLKGDDSEGFQTKKMFNVTRKRMFGIFGGEPTLENPGKYDLAVPSLEEGVEIKDLPMAVNSLRMGSYNRGAATALGGTDAKFGGRMYQNTSLIEEDCGSVIGLPTVVTSFNKSKLTGRYVVVKGKTKKIGDTSKLVGNHVMLRAPARCRAADGNYCPTCMGDSVVDSKIGPGPQAFSVGNNFLQISLSLFHGRAMESARYKYKEAIQ